MVINFLTHSIFFIFLATQQILIINPIGAHIYAHAMVAHLPYTYSFVTFHSLTEQNGRPSD